MAEEQRQDGGEWTVACGKAADERAIDPLIAFLRGGGDTELRRTAAVALGEYDDPRAVAALSEAVTRDWDAEVRRYAVESLGQEGIPSVVLPLIKALGDGHEAVRDTAVEALARVGVCAVPVLIDALGHRSLTIRCGAALALGRSADARAIPPLIEALRAPEYEDALSQAAAQSLGKMASRHPDPQLCHALPLLRRLAQRDGLYRDVMRRIEASTADVRRLPIPAAQPAPSTADLPIPAPSPAPSPDGLPIPSSRAAGENEGQTSASCPWANARWQRTLRRWIGRGG